MDNLDKMIIVEKFVNNIDNQIIDIEKLITFLRIEDENTIKALNESISIFKKKTKKIKKCKNIDEVKKHIKFKKVRKDHESKPSF